MKKILTIAAHPDDEILGCGGTIARLVEEGNEAYTLILGEGITSRDESRDREKREGEIRALKENIDSSNKHLGVLKTYLFDFPDNRFDSVPLLDIIKVIERVKSEIRPDIIFTHHRNDLNIDHQITYKAVLTATRPLIEETVKEIYAFEVLSSTEWQFPNTFNPNLFFDITKTIDKKKRAMLEYKSECKEFPHPRSLKGIEMSAENWGLKVGLSYVEAFETVRAIF